MHSLLVAGVAGVDITPPVGVDLTGFGGRPGPAESVHDDLAARVLYLSDGQSRAWLVALDLIGLSRAESLALRNRIARLAGGSPDSVIVACSHTHSGPATHCLRFLGEPDETYLAQTADAVVECASQALAAAVPVRAGWGRGEAGIGINRRQRQGGAMRLGANAAGPVDNGVSVLRIDTLAGQPMARVFSHAAHAVTLGGDSLAISADWPGYARRAIEAKGEYALFLQGCCGNVNCRERNTFAAAEVQGETVAKAALAAAGAPTEERPLLRVGSTLLDLPLQPPPSPEECAHLLADMIGARNRLSSEANRGQRWVAEAAIAWAEELSRLSDASRTLPFEIQALRVGEGALVALPGEVFVEYAHQITAASPFAVTAVAAYASDCPSYIPTATAYAEGGYEVDNAIRYYGTTMPFPDSEACIVAAATALLGRLAG